MSIAEVTLDAATEPVVYAPNLALSLAEARDVTGDAGLVITKPDWSRLSTDCIQVKLSISVWRAKEKLQAHHLGLDAASPEFREFASQYLRLGHISLLPGRYWKPFESKEELARRAISACGFRSPFAPAWLVPLKAYKAARETLQLLEGECDGLVNRICAERDPFLNASGELQPGWLIEVRGEIQKLVATALAVRAGLPPGTVPSASQFAEIDQLVEAITSKIPTSDQIRAMYSFGWVPSFVAKPALLGEGIDVADLEARALAAQAAHEGYAARIAADQATLADRTAEEKARLELQAVQEELEAKRLIAIDIAERAAGEQLREISGLLNGAAAKVAGTLFAGIKEIRRSTNAYNEVGKNTGGVHGKQIKKMLRLAEQVRLLLAWDSPSTEKLAQAVKELAAELEGAPSSPDSVSKLHRTLGDIQAVVAADLMTLGDPDRELLDLKDEDPRDFLLEDRREEALGRLGLIEPVAVDLLVGERVPEEDLLLAG